MRDTDYIKSLDNLCRALEEEAQSDISSGLRDLIRGASTGTELLISTRGFILVNILKKEGLPEHIYYAAKEVAAQIKVALGDTFVWGESE